MTHYPRLPKDTRYYYDGLHYSNEGGELVGSLLAAEIGPFLRLRLENPAP